MRKFLILSIFPGIFAITLFVDFSEIQLLCFISSLLGFYIIYTLIEFDNMYKGLDPFNPKYFFLIGFSVFIFVPMFKLSFSNELIFNDFSEALLIISLCYCALLSFLFPFKLLDTKSFRYLHKGNSNKSINIKHLIIITFLYSTVSISVIKFFNLESSDPFFNMIGYLGYMNGAAGIFSGYLIFIKRYKKSIIIKIMLLIIFISTISLSTSRTPFMYIIGSLLLLYIWEKKIKKQNKYRANMHIKTGYLLLIPIMLLILGFYKAFNVLYIEDSSLRDINIKYAINHSFRFEFADAFINLIALKHLFLDNNTLLWGETIFALFVNPIPRIIWENKPKSLGYILPSKIFLTDNPSVSLATSFIGELLVNFSYVGVIIGHFILGIICILLYKKFRLNYWKENVAFPYTIFLFIVFVESRGDFLTANFRGINYALFVWLGIMFSMRNKFRY